MVVPPPTVYHRLLGWHAPDMRRLVTAAAIGLVVGLGAATLVRWQVALLLGWDAAASVFLGSVWPIIVRADGPGTERLATREDLTRDTARLLLLGASTASLVSVMFALRLAGRQGGNQQLLLVAIATLTVVASWAVLNTVFTLRYAGDYYGAPASPASPADPNEPIDFGGAPADDRPDYRDFAYIAFTIGMTYQVSDTNLRNRRIRRTVLLHAVLSYVFGVVIVAAAVNIIAGLAS